MEPTSSNPGAGAPDPLIGAVFGGKYKVIDKIGSGGMGGVYRAEHQLMNRIVALKVLRSNLAHDEILLKRFHHEAKAASQISHPNAVTLFDYGVDNDSPYLVMEYIEGMTLKGLIAAEAPLDIERVGDILHQICAALNEAHKAGIIHRDIKPDNFMVRKNDRGEDVVKVLDFGVAKSVGMGDMGDANLTQAGMIIGTPQYISPEQCQGKILDPRCDIYSLGICVYEMLTGDVPFRAPTVLELLVKVLHHGADPIRTFKPDLNIPPEIDKAVMKSIEKDRDLRYATALEFYEAYDNAIPRFIKKEKKTALIAAAALCVVLGVGLVYALNRAPVSEDTKKVEALAEAVKKAEKEKADALKRIEALRSKGAELLKQNDLEKADAIKKQQEAAESAELEKETALWQAQVAKEQAEKALAEARKGQAENANALKVQQEAARKAEEEKQKAIKQAEEAKREAERQAEALRKKGEEEKALALKIQQEAQAQAEKEKEIALKKAEKERDALIHEQEEMAKKAEKEKDEALKQAAAARAELEKLSAAAKKAESERADAMRQMEEAKKKQAEVSTKTPGKVIPPADAEANKKNEARLNEIVRKANEQKAEAQRRVEQIRAEADRQAAAAQRATAEAERAKAEAARRAVPVATPAVVTPPPEDKPKVRRRCGPTWCLD